MRLYYDRGVKYLTAERCDRPKFVFAKKPTEQSPWTVTIDGTEVRWHSFGERVYFTLGDENDREAKWWSLPLLGTYGGRFTTRGPACTKGIHKRNNPGALTKCGARPAYRTAIYEPSISNDPLTLWRCKRHGGKP